MRRKTLLFLAVPVLMAGVGWMADDKAEGGIIFHRRGGAASCCGVSAYESCAGRARHVRRYRARASCCGVVETCCEPVMAPTCSAGFVGTGTNVPPAPTGHFEYRRELAPSNDSANQPTEAPVPPPADASGQATE